MFPGKAECAAYVPDCGDATGPPSCARRESDPKHRRYDRPVMLSGPKTINTDGLLPFLGLLAANADAAELRMDFSGLRRVSPSALAALTAFMTGR